MSASTAFAVSDEDVIQEANDEANLAEISLDEPDEIAASDVDEPIEESTEEVVLTEQEPPIVTKDNFSNYFEDDGTLKDTVTDKELILKGEFSNTSDLHYLTILKPIKLTGKNAVLNNISIIIGSSNVTIDSFTINTGDATVGIHVGGPSENVAIINNKINFVGIENDNDACGIFADSADNLNIIANVVTFTGKGNATGNKVIKLAECDGVIIDGNKFDVTVPSSGYMAGVIDFDYASDDIQFINNDVVIVGVPTDFTINGICFNGNNVTVSGNNISVSGNSYTYGIGAYGSNSKVTNNKVIVSSDIYYACGIDLEGSSWTIVDGNEFIISSTGSAYGIYSGMTSGGLIGNYTNNNINLNSYFAIGIELGSVDESVIGNTITVKGNYTIGVGALIPTAYVPPTWAPTVMPIVNRLVQGNIINTVGTNVGNATSGDSIPIITTGIYSIPGNITIKDNKISTNGDYAVIFVNSTAPSLVTKNNLVAKSLKGDESVLVVGDVKVSENTPTKEVPTPSTPTNKVTKKSVKITAKKKTFKAKTKTKKYTIIVKAGKKAVKGLKVTLKVKGKTYKATTNAKGKATFKIKNLKKKGKYTAKVNFAGNDLYNKVAKSVKITVKK